MQSRRASYPAPKHPLITKGCWKSNHRVRGSRRKITCAVRTAAHASSPYCVEWLEARSDTPIPQLLKQIASVSGDDQLMLVAGNSTYYPALFRQAKGVE